MLVDTVRVSQGGAPEAVANRFESRMPRLSKCFEFDRLISLQANELIAFSRDGRHLALITMNNQVCCVCDHVSRVNTRAPNLS